MPTEEQLYPTCIVCVRDRGFRTTEVKNLPFLVRAHSTFEAQGKADAIANGYRREWACVSVAVGEPDKVWEPKK